eukprot:139634-Pleurochrysis_carterae.AAC.1
MLVARSTLTIRCDAAGHPTGAPSHRSPCAPHARSSRSRQSAAADSSAACEPAAISMATPGGVPAASASA